MAGALTVAGAMTWTGYKMADLDLGETGGLTWGLPIKRRYKMKFICKIEHFLKVHRMNYILKCSFK